VIGRWEKLGLGWWDPPESNGEPGKETVEEGDESEGEVVEGLSLERRINLVHGAFVCEVEVKMKKKCGEG